MAIVGLILLLAAGAQFATSLLGVNPAGVALGAYMLLAALFALGMAVSESHGLHLRHRRVR